MRNPFVSFLMNKLEFNDDEKQFFYSLENKVINDNEILSLIYDFMEDEVPMPDIKKRVQAISEAINIPYESFYFYFLMRSSEQLLEKYKEKGIVEEYFWDASVDLRCKLRESKDTDGIYAAKYIDWHTAFFKLTRFALGRFQYEIIPYINEAYEKNGLTVRHGEPVLNIHIPASGPLTREARFDSYTKAFRFFTSRYQGSFSAFIPCVCRTWLLFPEHLTMLPELSNILSFMSDFDIIDSKKFEDFPHASWIFGSSANLPPDQLPCDSSLRRAYIERLRRGEPMGNGFGILLYDGEKILNK